MEASEIVEKINKGEKVGDIAESLGIAQSTLSRRLRLQGYVYNNKTKIYELNETNSEENMNKLGKKSDKTQKKLEEKSEFPLTEDEVKFIKKLAKGRTEWERNFELNYEFSQLPLKHQTKKASYEINEKIYEDFDKFAESFGKPRNLSRNVLVELALRKFMRDFE